MASPTTDPRSTLRSKLLIGFGIVIAMLALITTISVQSTRGFNRTSQWVSVTYEAIQVQERMLRNVTELEQSRSMFLLFGEEAALRRYRAAQAELTQNINSLRVLTAATPGEAA